MGAMSHTDPMTGVTTTYLDLGGGDYVEITTPPDLPDGFGVGDAGEPSEQYEELRAAALAFVEAYEQARRWKQDYEWPAGEYNRLAALVREP